MPKRTKDPLARARQALKRVSSHATVPAVRDRKVTSANAEADEWLLWGAEPRVSSPALFRRAGELTSPENRVMLARLTRRLLGELDRPRCRAYAVNRPAMRASYRQLVELAERLGNLERPVSPAGIVLASRLLRDGAGPLFDHARSDELGPAVREALAALDGVGHSVEPRAGAREHD